MFNVTEFLFLCEKQESDDSEIHRVILKNNSGPKVVQDCIRKDTISRVQVTYWSSHIKISKDVREQEDDRQALIPPLIKNTVKESPHKIAFNKELMGESFIIEGLKFNIILQTFKTDQQGAGKRGYIQDVWILEEELDVNTVESFCFLDKYLVVVTAQLSLLIHIQCSSSNFNGQQTEVWAPDDVRLRPSWETDPRWTIFLPNFWSWRTRIVQDVVSSHGSSIGRSEITFIVSLIPYVDGLLQNRIQRLIGLQKMIHFRTSRSRCNDISRNTFRRETHVKLFRMTSNFVILEPMQRYKKDKVTAEDQFVLWRLTDSQQDSHKVKSFATGVFTIVMMERWKQIQYFVTFEVDESPARHTRQVVSFLSMLQKLIDDQI